MAAQTTPMDYAFYAAAALVVAYLLWTGLRDKQKMTPYE